MKLSYPPETLTLMLDELDPNDRGIISLEDFLSFASNYSFQTFPKIDDILTKIKQAISLNDELKQKIDSNNIFSILKRQKYHN